MLCLAGDYPGKVIPFNYFKMEDKPLMDFLLKALPLVPPFAK